MNTETLATSVRSTLLQREVTWLLDVVAVLAYLGVANAALVSLPDGSAPKALLALPLLLFVQGYAVVSALYPGRVEQREERSLWESVRDGPPSATDGWLERGVLSGGISVALTSTFGVAFPLLGHGLATDWMVVAAVDGVVLVGVLVGTARRLGLRPKERFRLPYRTWRHRFVASTASSRSALDRLIAVGVVLLVLASVGSFAYALVSPPSGERYTSMTLLTRNESGAYVAGGYPANLTAGEPATLHVGIGNREGEPVEYTVVPVVQRVNDSGGSLVVEEQRRHESFRVALGANESTYTQHRFTPRVTGTELRLVYLLYVAEPPADPSVDSAYRHVYVWVNVSAPPRER